MASSLEGDERAKRTFPKLNFIILSKVEKNSVIIVFSISVIMLCSKVFTTADNSVRGEAFEASKVKNWPIFMDSPGQKRKMAVIARPVSKSLFNDRSVK